MTSLAQLGAQVRAARKATGLTQEELARRAGLSRYTLVKLERGQINDMGYGTLTRLLAPLGLELRVSERAPTGLPILGEP